MTCPVDKSKSKDGQTQGGANSGRPQLTQPIHYPVTGGEKRTHQKSLEGVKRNCAGMTEIFGDKTLLSKGCSNEFPTSTDQEDKSILVSKEVLRRKVVCLFFSASWCAPCQHFVPVLKEIYTELRRRGEPLEIVFLSFDKTEEEMMNYYKQKHGDWLAVKFGDPLRDVLAERYSICVIPKLVVIQGNGDLITSKGRKDVQDKGIICMRSWFSHLVVEDLQNKEDEENVQREENRIAV